MPTTMRSCEFSHTFTFSLFDSSEKRLSRSRLVPYSKSFTDSLLLRASKVINFVRRDSESQRLFSSFTFVFLQFTDSPQPTLYTPLRCSCNFNTGNCDVHGTTIGADCSSDNQFFCTQTSARQPLACDAVTQTCQPSGPVPSARARSRRAEIARRSLCSPGHHACSVGGSLGFECMDLSVSFPIPFSLTSHYSN